MKTELLLLGHYLIMIKEIEGFSPKLAIWPSPTISTKEHGETVIFQTYSNDKVSTNLKLTQLSGVMQVFEEIDDA